MGFPAPMLFTLALLALLLLPSHAAAFELAPGWANAICGVVPCSGGGTGIAGLASYVTNHLITALQIGFVAAAIVSLFLATLGMVFFHTDEGVVKESKNAFYYTITGGAFVAFTSWLIEAFAPDPGSVVRSAPVESGIGNAILFFKLLLSIALITNIVVQAIRLVSSQGEQEQTEKAKKRLIAGFIGVALVLLVNAIKTAVAPGSNSGTVAVEIRGIANFMLTVFAFLAVAVIIVAGILLVVSADESLKEKSKSMIKTSVIAAVVVVVAYALVNAFVLIP